MLFGKTIRNAQLCINSDASADALVRLLLCGCACAVALVRLPLCDCSNFSGYRLREPVLCAREGLATHLSRAGIQDRLRMEHVSRSVRQAAVADADIHRCRLAVCAAHNDFQPACR